MSGASSVPETSRRNENRLPLARMLAAAAFLVLLIAVVHRASPRTLVSAHGLLHSAIAERFLAEPLTIPPENPFFAGEPVRYYWFFHAMGAAVSRLLGLDPLHSFELLIAAATAAMVFLVTGLARSLYGRATVGFAIGYLVLAGAQAQAPLVLAWRVVKNGTGLLADDPEYLWGLVHPVSRHMRLWDEYGQLGPLINYFFNITARPLALVALLAMIWALYRVLSRGGAAGTLILSGSVALLSSLNPLIGIAAVGALGVGLIACESLRRREVHDALALDSAPHLIPALAAMGGGLLLGGLTFWQLLTAGGTGIEVAGPGAAFHQMRGIVAAAWLLLCLAILALARMRGLTRFLGFALILSALLQMAAAALVRLPAGNQDNLYHAALVMLAVPAAAIVLRRDGHVHRTRAVALFVVFLPVTLLVVWAYTGRPPVDIGFAESRLVRSPADSDSGRLYRWITASTPGDAVMIIDPGPPTRAVAGNTAELPALTGRVLFTERTSHYIVSAHADAEQRERMSRQIVAGEALSAADERYLSALGREIYLVVERASREHDEAVTARYGEPLFESGPLALYRWSRQRSHNQGDAEPLAELVRRRVAPQPAS